MSTVYLRTFKPYDIEDVKKHILIMGDLSSSCGSCRELGIDSQAAKACPNCGTTFKYVTSRRLESHAGERFQWARRTHGKFPDLILIDYSDYSKSIGKKQARDFFG